VDIIDEYIQSHYGLKTENDILSKLQKNCLSDRANKSKIRFMQESNFFNYYLFFIDKLYYKNILIQI
jgi:hypothetical protein